MKWYTMTPDQVARNPKLSHGAKTTYIVLLSYTNKGRDTCWPRQDTLCRYVDVTPNTLRRFLIELRDMGLISWKRRGLGKSNLYTFHTTRPAKKRVAAAPTVASESSGKPAAPYRPPKPAPTSRFTDLSPAQLKIALAIRDSLDTGVGPAGEQIIVELVKQYPKYSFLKAAEDGRNFFHGRSQKLTVNNFAAKVAKTWDWPEYQIGAPHVATGGNGYGKRRDDVGGMRIVNTDSEEFQQEYRARQEERKRAAHQQASAGDGRQGRGG